MFRSLRLKVASGIASLQDLYATCPHEERDALGTQYDG